MLAGVQHVVLVGAVQPTAFFAYPGKPGRLTPPDAAIHVLARPEQDLADALAQLAEALGAPRRALRRSVLPRRSRRAVRSRPRRSRTRSRRCCRSRRSWPTRASPSAARFFPATRAAAPHDWLQVTGGAIGGGLPLATGAAIGAPGRRVVSLEADGSAMYTLQALWTQAREQLDVTTVIFSNRKYAILLHELANVGANPGRTALDMLDLGNPDLDFVRLANGMGVEAARAETMEQFNDLFASANARRGPFVIDLIA